MRLNEHCRRPKHPRALSLGALLVTAWIVGLLSGCATPAGAPPAPPVTQTTAVPTAAPTQAPSLTTVPAAAPVSATKPANSAPATPSTAPTAPPTPAPAIKGDLIVFAAASLTDAFKEVGAAVEKANPGAKVILNFAGSTTLRAQLAQGARADLFASADEPNIEAAQKEGTVVGTPQIFAQNAIVIIVSNQSTAGIATLQDLARPGVKLVIGQKELPAGNYARQILAKMSADPAYGAQFGDKVLANLVSEENNVKAVVSKVQMGEADAGVCFISDVTPSVQPDVKVLKVPDQFSVVARYPIIVVKDAANEAGAQAFIAYLLSPAGQDIMERNGFVRVDTKR